MSSTSALNWKITGAAGEGVKSTGQLFSKTCLRSGLFTFDYTDYPSLIRGGHNTYQVKAANKKVYSQEKNLDVLVALNKNGLKLHSYELTKNTVIIADLEDLNLKDNPPQITGTLNSVPLFRLAVKVAGDRLMGNNVALGVSVFLLGLDLNILNSVIKDTFDSKGQKVVDQNLKAALAGHDYAKKNLKPIKTLKPTPNETLDDVSMTGNDALSLGAIAGGLKAFIAYPMTPSSSILHTLASWADKTDILVKHAEDEIGVINMALGSSFAGVRTAVATSGGGFAYMTEALGLSGVAELPVVIFEAQRPGPALGMPTWTAQADLLFATFASQDEFPRVILAPGDIKEAFELSKFSFEIAEKYQLPVIVLSDKHLSESAQSTRFNETTFSHQQVSIDRAPKTDDTGFYKRYKDSETGVSPRTVPGQKGGFHIANSYETDEHGIGSEEISDRVTQMNKRMRKLDTMHKDIPKQYYHGSKNPQITFICWGSTKLAVMAGVEKLKEQGVDAAVLNISFIWPFPKDQVIDVIQKSQNVMVVEGNYMNQLGMLIKQQTGIDIYHKRRRYDGRPFYPYQIVQFAKEILHT